MERKKKTEQPAAEAESVKTETGQTEPGIVEPVRRKPGRQRKAKVESDKTQTADEKVTRQKTMRSKAATKKKADASNEEKSKKPTGEPKALQSKKKRTPAGTKFKPGEERAREAGRKGGMRSAEIRASRKSLREELLTLLTVTSKGADGKDHSQQEAISIAMIRAAREGNVRAFETIRDTIGEKPVDKVDVAVSGNRERLHEAFARINFGSDQK